MKKNFILLSLLLFSGCAALEPLVQDFNIVSVADETLLGEKMSAEVAKQYPLANDSAQLQRVRVIGSRLVSALPKRDFNYEFYVVEDKTPNAFTIPGGKIYVHTGLLNFVANDAELAGVMGHEVGHAYDRHPAKSISREYGAQYLSQILFRNNKNALQTLSLQALKGGILTRYGREDELMADEIAYFLLQRAGMRTDGLLSFFNKLQMIQGKSSLPSFLSTHPPTPERIARLRALETGLRKPQVSLPPAQVA